MQERIKKTDKNEHFILICGLITGFALVLISFIILRYFSAMPFYLTLCIGLGLLTGALGTTATVKFKGYVITGGGAVGFIFFLAVQQNIKTGDVTFGIIEGPFSIDTRIAMQDREELLGALRGADRKSFHFIVRGDKIELSRLLVSIDGNWFSIDRKFVDPLLLKKKTIEWRYDSSNKIIIDMQDKDTIGFLDFVSAPVKKESSLRPIAMKPFHLVLGICYAQTDTEEIWFQSMVTQLKSENARVNMNGIQELAGRGLKIVAPLMNKFSESVTEETFCDSGSCERFRKNAIQVVAILFKKSPDSLLDTLSDANIGDIVETAKKDRASDALYAQLFLNKCGTGSTPSSKRVLEIAKTKQYNIESGVRVKMRKKE